MYKCSVRYFRDEILCQRSVKKKHEKKERKRREKPVCYDTKCYIMDFNSLQGDSYLHRENRAANMVR